MLKVNAGDDFLTDGRTQLLDAITDISKYVGTRIRFDVLCKNIIVNPKNLEFFFALVLDGRLTSRDGYVWPTGMSNTTLLDSTRQMEDLIQVWQKRGVPVSVTEFLATSPGCYMPPHMAILALSHYGPEYDDIIYHIVDQITPDATFTVGSMPCDDSVFMSALTRLFYCTVDVSSDPFDKIIRLAKERYIANRREWLTAQLEDHAVETTRLEAELAKLN